MTSRPFLGLAIALVMFPQIAQTLYSPALADISLTFAVSAEMAAQMLSVFFLGFALGVVVWGASVTASAEGPPCWVGWRCMR